MDLKVASCHVPGYTSVMYWVTNEFLNIDIGYLLLTCFTYCWKGYRSMAGGWIERKDANGNLVQRIREEDAKLFCRRNRFERGYCEVWTDDFDRMYEIIDKRVTCKILGMRLIPKLMRLAEFDTGDILIDQADLAKELGVSRQNVSETLGEFLKLELLEVVGKQSRHNIYRLPERVIWKGRSEKRLKLINGESDKKFDKFIKSSPSEPSTQGEASEASGEGTRAAGRAAPDARKSRKGRSGAVAAKRGDADCHPR